MIRAMVSESELPFVSSPFSESQTDRLAVLRGTNSGALLLLEVVCWPDLREPHICVRHFLSGRRQLQCGEETLFQSLFLEASKQGGGRRGTARSERGGG